MNIINKLFDEQFVINLFKKRVLPEYPNFNNIKRVEIIPCKKYIWEETYHVVIEFKTFFTNKEGKVKKLSIYCSAHSNEPRKNVYDGLKFLWNHGFNKGYLSIPHPLFYSHQFKATFYRGANGRNLYRFIREKNLKEIKEIIPKAAAWFAKLHKIQTKNAHNFNRKNSRIETVIPGIEHILERIKEHYEEYYEDYKKMHEIFNKKEKDFFASTAKRWLVHGDAHPENIIKMSKRKIAVIDFTDLCLSDFARDLGAFTQQVEFMCNRKIGNPEYARKIKDLFLENYLHCSKIILNNSLKERIDNYYNWTAIRTATFFLLKYNPEPERARPLIDKVRHNLKI